jgi:hypothetical protein
MYNRYQIILLALSLSTVHLYTYDVFNVIQKSMPILHLYGILERNVCMDEEYHLLGYDAV